MKFLKYYFALNPRPICSNFHIHSSEYQPLPSNFHYCCFLFGLVADAGPVLTLPIN